MNTCDTCKWWGREDWARKADIEPMRLCQKIEDVPNDEDMRDTDAGIYNSIDSSLATGPKFGCSLHETE